jgi:signal transduction histidine kinase
LRIINKQKQLAEIKNDLISNITHEFKTPITTISTALQGIQSFNDQDDKEKTNKYLAMSNQQVDKLNLMVEKLLETATLDSDQLHIEKEPTDLAAIIEQVCEKHAMIAEGTTIETKLDDVGLVMVDPFHFENAMANIIDNAIKYGGDLVKVKLLKTDTGFEFTVTDNGTGIPKQQQALVFEKFYRVPKGNVHDVKGFGIGLYYSQKIIDKHGGQLTLSSQPGSTVFKITMA